MKTLVPFFLVGALGLAVLGGAQVVGPATAPVPAQTGKVLVLDNEATIEGDIDRVGQQYRVRRAIGATYWPANRVLGLCGSMVEAYEFLRNRCNQRDADERLHLAEWCRQRGLREQALLEVRAAVALRPEHAPSQRLLQILSRSAPPSTPGAPASSEAEPGPLPALELSAEAMTQFTNKVQPILMNACAGCHANGKGGAFKLTRTYEPAGAPRRTTLSNAVAVLGQIDLHQPTASALLLKAVSVHGEMAAAPFRNRQATAFRTLEDWVVKTADTHAHLRETPTVTQVQATMPAPATPAGSSFAADRPPEPAGTPRQLPPLEGVRELPPPATAAPAPAIPPKPQPQPVDPFDPEGFNRQTPRPMPPTAPSPGPTSGPRP